MAQRLDGKSIALTVRQSVARRVGEFRAKYGRPPELHVVLAGDDPASAVYVSSKERAAGEAGMNGAVHRLPANVGEPALLELVGRLNASPTVDGILVQLPLPKHISAERVLQLIDPRKDVDGLHPVNIGALWSGQPGLVPCTPRGCMHLIREAGATLNGARAVVIGRSNLVGKPIAALLLAENATVTLAHSKTRELPALCREADVLIAAVGRAGLVRGDWIKPGAVVIDVGTTKGEDGKLRGDVVFAEAEPVAGAITPVPGGVQRVVQQHGDGHRTDAAERRVQRG